VQSHISISWNAPNASDGPFAKSKGERFHIVCEGTLR
jgi:hypothetical protein